MTNEIIQIKSKFKNFRSKILVEKTDDYEMLKI